MTVGHALQDVAEPEGFDVVELCGGDEGADGCPSDAATVGAREQMAFAVRAQLPVYSAHVGQDVEAFYRWHALYGRRVRPTRLEPRANGQIAYVETFPGEVLIMAAWMLDPVSCAGMQMAEPRASLAALADLHRLLVACGLKQSSEDPNARLVPAPSITKPTHQLNLTFGPRPLSGLSTTDRARSVALLTFLLAQAAGAATEERDDVQR